MGEKRKNNLYLQGSILALASILTRIMGIVFRVPLTRIIGDEGIGAYSNAYEIYNLALLLTTYSIPTAVSKLVSMRESKKEYINSYRVFQSALIFSVVAGGFAAVVTFFGAEFFAMKLFKSASSAIPLKFLAPTIFIFAIMGVLRGYFQGKNTVLPTAVSQLIEQFFHVVVGLSAAVIFMQVFEQSEQQVAYGAAGGTFGTLAGAIASLLFLLVIFAMYYPVAKRRFKRDCGAEREPLGYLIQLVIITALPIILNQTLNTLNGTIDSALLNHVLDGKGVSEEVRLVLLGRYTSKYRLLANLPLSVSTAIGVAIVPTIAGIFAQEDWEQLRAKIGQSVKFNMMIVIPAAVGLAVLARPIMQLLFADTTDMTPLLMQTGAMAIVFYSYSTTTSNVLQGIGKMRYPVLHSIAAIVIYVFFDYIMLEYLNMSVYALVVGHTIFPMVLSILNGLRVWQETGYVQEWKRTFAMPVLCSAVMGFVAYFSYLGVHSITDSMLISLCVAIFFAVYTYFVLMIATKTLSEEELYDLPMGGRLVKLVKMIGLIRE